MLNNKKKSNFNSNLYFFWDVIFFKCSCLREICFSHFCFCIPSSSSLYLTLFHLYFPYGFSQIGVKVGGIRLIPSQLTVMGKSQVSEG